MGGARRAVALLTPEGPNSGVFGCIEESMDEGLSRLEARVDALASSLEEIEVRLRALEDRISPNSEETGSPGGEERRPEVIAGASKSESSQAIPILSLGGQTCLVLGGAYLLRAMTDMAVLPTQLGLMVGLGYAVGWLFFADFFARRGKRLGATFFGTSAVIIAYPLVSEAVTTFGAVNDLGSSIALCVITAIALGVAWRRDLPVLAWLTILATIATVFVLVIATHRMVPFAVVLLLLGGGAVWLTYSRDWIGLGWLPAIAVDLLISAMIHLASRPYGIPESYPDVSVAVVMTVAFGLLFVYLASFAVQTLLRNRDVSVFEMVQTAAVLVVGFGGAVQVAEASGSGSTVLGAGALVLAFAYYIVTFTFSDLRWGYGKNHLFYVWLAFILVLTGCYLVTNGLPLLLAWCVLSIVAAVLGTRYYQPALYYQSAAYAVAAAILAVEIPGGLITFAVEIFTSPADQPWPQITIPSLVIIVATTVVSYVVLAVSKADPEHNWRIRIPRFVVVLLAALGIGAVAVLVLTRALGSAPPEADAAVVAAVRTGVVASAAVVLAALSRIPACLDLRWLVYLLFVLGGLKLALEDLPEGRPATLFVAFALYGIALIFAPRLARSGQYRRKAPLESQEP
jgi:hypothetical protein